MALRYEALDDKTWDGSPPKLASRARSAARWLLEILRPALFTRNGPRRQLRRTAYLDGLRGFAAFLVYWQHHQLWPLRRVFATLILENGFGYNGFYYFATLPVVRTFFSGGHFAVAVFFVISGYVLSAKPLALIYAGHFEELGDNLSSALFRRWIRLHVPIILVTLAYICSWHLFGIWTESPIHKSNFRDELWNWYIEFKSFSFAFRQGGEAWFTYNFPTWSIPVEFRGSLIIYTSLLAFSRSTRDMRLLCQVGLIIYFLYIVDGWYGSLFIAGMLLCELDLLARNDNLPSIINRLKRWKTAIYYTFFFISMYLSGVPSHSLETDFLRKTPGWYWLSFLKPQAVFDQKWFYLFWAAIFFVSSIPRIWWLKSFFETSFNQYLGRISFSLYLVHGPILWMLGDRIYAAVGWYKEIHEQNIPEWVNIMPLPESGPMGLEPRFLIPHIIILPFTLWVAEIVTKLCDEPVVRFSQWTYAKTLATPRAPLEVHG